MIFSFLKKETTPYWNNAGDGGSKSPMREVQEQQTNHLWRRCRKTKPVKEM